MGVREGELPEDLADYVLSDFPEERVLVVQEMVGQAAEATECLVRRRGGRGHEPLQRPAPDLSRSLS